MIRLRAILLTAMLVGAGFVYYASLSSGASGRDMTAEEFFASLNPEPVALDSEGLDRLRAAYPEEFRELKDMSPQEIAASLRNDYGMTDEAQSAGGRLYPLEVSQ